MVYNDFVLIKAAAMTKTVASPAQSSGVGDSATPTGKMAGEDHFRASGLKTVSPDG